MKVSSVDIETKSKYTKRNSPTFTSKLHLPKGLEIGVTHSSGVSELASKIKKTYVGLVQSLKQIKSVATILSHYKPNEWNELSLLSTEKNYKHLVLAAIKLKLKKISTPSALEILNTCVDTKNDNVKMEVINSVCKTPKGENENRFEERIVDIVKMAVTKNYSGAKTFHKNAFNTAIGLLDRKCFNEDLDAIKSCWDKNSGKFVDSELDFVPYLAKNKALDRTVFIALNRVSAPSPDVVKKLLTLPVGKTMETPEVFLANRIKTSYVQGKFYPEKFEKFNELTLGMTSYYHFANIHHIIQQCWNEKAGRFEESIDLAKTVIKNHSTEDCYMISKYFTDEDNPHIKYNAESIGKLAELEGISLVSVINSLSNFGSVINKTAVDKFIELYPQVTLSSTNLAKILAKCVNPKKPTVFFDEVYEFAKEHLLSEEQNIDELNLILDNCIMPSGDINLAILDLIKGIQKKYGIRQKHAVLLIKNPMCQELINLREKSMDNRANLEGINYEISRESVDELLFGNINWTQRTLDMIGEEAFLYSYKNKYPKVAGYVKQLGETELPESALEDLKRIINPKKSKKYEELTQKIKEEKQKFQQIQDKKELKLCMNRINTHTKALNDMLKASLKDPYEVLETAILYKRLYEYLENEYDVKKMKEYLPLFHYTNMEEKQKLYSKLQFVLVNQFNMTPSEKTLEKMDLVSNPHFSALFKSDLYFQEHLMNFIDILDKYPNKKVSEILNNLPQNRETKKQFGLFGVNYNNWVKFNPDSKIEFRILNNGELLRRSAIKNFKNAVFKEVISPLTADGKEELQNIFGQKGFDIVDFTRNGNPIEVTDIKELVEIFKKISDDDDFWVNKNISRLINTTRNNWREEIIKNRYNEVKRSMDKISDKKLNLHIQKADMNNIGHSLFLGNYSSCCSAVDGYQSYSAITYLKNKVVSAIELYDNGVPVGNTMCYVALVNGYPALILDNLEMKPLYQYNDAIRDKIIEYAKQVLEEIELPNAPVYAGTNRHKQNLEDYPQEFCNIRLLGSTGNDEIFLDFLTRGEMVSENAKWRTSLYKLA